MIPESGPPAQAPGEWCLWITRPISFHRHKHDGLVGPLKPVERFGAESRREQKGREQSAAQKSAVDRIVRMSLRKGKYHLRGVVSLASGAFGPSVESCLG